MARVSYSQFGMYSSCQEQFKLNYIDKLGISNANIHLIFGSSMHEVIQHFLDVMYNVTKKQALQLNLEQMLQDKLVEHFKKEKEKMGEDDPCTKEELQEFYEDGVKILEYFRNKLDSLYAKSGWRLVAIEQRLNAEIKPGVNFIGFIDILLEDLTTNEYVIIDLKTSTRGWNKYQKADKTKISQMLLYKKFYSDKYGIPLDKIKVEYQILKRKLYEGADFPIPRISKFVPANGKPSVNRAWNDFKGFVDSVYGDEGQVIQEVFPPNKGKQCDWCEFKTRKLCSLWK